MCGIFGHTTGKTFNAQLALDKLFHRGPDGQGWFKNNQVELGHRRLSILDLSAAGSQPMTDSGVTVTCNGEIYNFQELRKQLENQHTFISHSDTEVLLHGYKEWGIDKLLEKIEGMFSFAIYDERSALIHLARDPIGIKPLYLWQGPEGVAWSSELKSIKAFIPADRLTIDQSALYDFHNYLYIPPPKSIFKQVSKVPAGHRVEIALVHTNAVTIKRYWGLDKNIFGKSTIPAPGKIRELIEASVKSHLVSDVPVGIFVSGGLDSSIIGFHARKHYGEDLQGFSIDVPGSSDDQIGSRALCEALGIRQHVEKFSSEDMMDEHLMSSLFDEPFADTSAYPMQKVSQLAHVNGIKVVLSGDGGDELFHGYRWYLRPKPWFLQAAARTIRSKKITHLHYEKDLLIRYIERLGAPNHMYRRTIAERYSIPKDYDLAWFFRKFYDHQLPPEIRWRFIDFNCYLPEDILTKVDRATMSVSLEARVPFLTKKMAEFAFGIPAEAFRADTPNGLKSILKDAYRSQLPSKVVDRPKKGFSIPLKKLGAFKGDIPQAAILKTAFGSST